MLRRLNHGRLEQVAHIQDVFGICKILKTSTEERASKTSTQTGGGVLKLVFLSFWMDVVSRGEVRLSPNGTSATIWPTVPYPDG